MRAIASEVIGYIKLIEYAMMEKVFQPPDKLIIKLHLRIIAKENKETEALTDETLLLSDTLIKEIKLNINNISDLEETVTNANNELLHSADEIFNKYVNLLRKLCKLDFRIKMSRETHIICLH